MVSMSTVKMKLLCFFLVTLLLLGTEGAPAFDLNHDDPDLEVARFRSLPLYRQMVVEIGQMNASSGAVQANVSCSVCRHAVGILQKMLDHKFSFSAIAKVAGELCYLAKIQNKNVCQGITQTFKDEMLTVVVRLGLGADEICGAFIDNCGNSYNPFKQYWNISVPGNKPDVKPVQPPSKGAPVTRILQLTDIHYDPLYTEGLTNQCGEPLCCRQPNAKGDNHTAAGPWGDYNCDVPNRTVVHLFQTLQRMKDDFDWVYWTGDLTAHNVWQQTREGTLSDFKYFYDLFDQYLPNKTVFPVFGNHDIAPVNGYPLPLIKGNLSASWLVEPTIGNWSRWLSQFPDWNETQATIRRGGFYSVKVREGLKVIGLQTAYCEKDNFWLLLNSTDGAGQLQWLISELLKAEQNGDKVHIIGHHPPGAYESIVSYGDNYLRIVNRFESTIIGQFFGHTHTDMFKIYMDETNTRPTNVLYVSPGVTSYQGLNLGFRIYTVDGGYNTSSHAVLDHDTYVFDIHEANTKNNPRWTLEYSAKESYNMTSLQPTDYYQLWKNMHTSAELRNLVNVHRTKNRTQSVISKETLLCEIVTTTTTPSKLCEQ